MLLLHNTDLKFTKDGEVYNFNENIDTMSIEDPSANALIRGLNGQSKKGMVAKTGLNEPAVITISSLNISKSFYNFLRSMQEAGDRFQLSGIDRNNAENYINASSCILANTVVPANIDNGEEAFRIDLVVQTFDYKYEIA